MDSDDNDDDWGAFWGCLLRFFKVDVYFYSLEILVSKEGVCTLIKLLDWD